MKIFSLFLLVLCTILVPMGSGYCQSTNIAPAWQHVITKNNTAYRVDMNSANFTEPDLLVFQFALDTPDNKTLVVVQTAARMSPNSNLEYCYQEAVSYDRNGNVSSRFTYQNNWDVATIGSPIDAMIFYIINNHPALKELLEN